MVLNGQAASKIVIPADASRHVLYARDRIQLSVSGYVGVSLAEQGDFAFQIFIGDTTDADSVALKSTLGTDEYAIKLIENKLIIVATNEVFLYEAARYFVDNYLKDPYARITDDEIVLLVDEINVKRAGDKTSLHYYFSQGTSVSAMGVPIATLDNQKYGPKDANPRYQGRQGGYFDGEYFYQAFIGSDEVLGVIGKKNIKTGELIYSEPYEIGHANDMTYDPNTNRILVGDGNNIFFFDADTLEYKETKTVGHSAARLSYSLERNTYIVHYFYFYDEDFNYTGEYFNRQLSKVTSLTELRGHGSSCDDTFIYWLLHKYVDGVYNTYIVVYDWYGNILAFVDVSNLGGYEPENISFVDGKLYVAACSTQPVTTLYRIEFGLEAVYENALITDGEVSAKIVLPEGESRYDLYARDKIQLGVESLVGVKFAEEGDAPFEILIGDTGREESIALKSTLGADEYAIKLIGNKLVIVASNDAFLYEAAKFFVDEYLKSPYCRIEGGELVLLTDYIDVKRAGDKTSIHYNLSLSTKPSASAVAMYTIDNQQYGVTDADPRIYRRQGGCFTGEYYYQVYITKNEELAVIAKKNVKTGELTYSEPRLMDHANDATYDPYTNRLFVGSGKTVWIYDADTLEFIESKTFSHTTSKFSYSPERHLYVLGSYYFYDDDLTYTKQYFKGSLSSLIGENNLSAQGSTCDDTFIYSLVFEKLSTGVYGCYFSVYDWYGNIVAFVTVSIPGDFEPENISVVDGTLYIAACSTQPVATLYRVDFV